MTAAPPNWHLAAAKFLRDEAEAQRQINARYPDHVKCYPSWAQRIRWAEGLALKLEGLHACTNAAQYCEPCRQLGKDPKHVRAAPQPAGGMRDFATEVGHWMRRSKEWRKRAEAAEAAEALLSTQPAGGEPQPAAQPEPVAQERYAFVLAQCREAQDMAASRGWALNDIATASTTDPRARKIATEALLSTSSQPAAQPEPVAFRCWHPKAERCYYVSTSPPEPFRSDTGEPNDGAKRHE